MNAIHDTTRNTLKKNSPEPKKPWINDNIIRDIEKRRKYKNAEYTHGIRRYKKLKNKINREAIFAKDKRLKKSAKNWNNCLGIIGWMKRLTQLRNSFEEKHETKQ